MKQTLAAGLLLILLLFLPPWLRWLNGSGEEASRSPAQEKQETEKEQEESGSSDAVHTMRLWDGETTQTMPVGEYLLGVVRGEMPAAFEAEALMAQAVAERTYLYYAMAAAPKKNHPDADVCTDPGCCTAWLGEAEAREKWGDKFQQYEDKVRAAVADTDGQVILYGGAPIMAVFHSSSAGRTAAAGDVWSGDLPYLVSVDSPEGEETVPNYYSTVTFTAAEAKEKLLAAHPELKLSGTPDRWFGAAAENGSGRVETVSVGGTDIEGTELRRIFGLRSACFTVAADSESVTFRVTGYGHGVGMSQYGANQLAREGKTWQEILEWYYTGATVGNA